MSAGETKSGTFCATGSRIGEIVGFPVPCVKDIENDVETRTTLESGSMEILEGASPSPVVLVQTGKSNPGQYCEILSEGDVETERPIDGLIGRNYTSKAH